MIYNFIALASACAFSYYCATWIFPKILQVAKIKSLVDNPNARKLQKTPIPLLGGLAVFFGLLMGMLLFLSAMRVFSPLEFADLLPVIIGAGVMLYVGAIDDVLGLTPKARLIIEVVAISGLIFANGMCVDSFHGLWGVWEFSWWIAVPMTVFAGVGLINAYNMVDGVNGLSSGLCISVCAMLGVIFWKRADYMDCALALCYGASLVPFLLHNVFGKRSRMFIGDGGTMVMGFMVSWFVIKILSCEYDLATGAADLSNLSVVAMMFAVASVPVFDTLRVMSARILRHESPFHADKTHLHHIFISVGVSHSITALSEVVINMMVVLIWYCSYKMGVSVEVQLYIMVVAAMALVWGTYFILRYQMKHKTRFLSRLYRVAAKTHFGHKKWWLRVQNRLDRGTYEDYMLILREKLNKTPEMMSPLERNQVTIVNYLQGKNKTLISDIVLECCMDEALVREAIDVLVSQGLVNVKKLDKDGKIAKVIIGRI